MRVLVDADLVLERFLQRSKFVEKAKNLFKLISVSENIEAYITDIGLEKIAKISSKLATKNKINAEDLIINQLQNKYKFKVFKVDEDILNKARKFDLINCESAVELSCAIAENFDGIVSEYSQKFGITSIPIMSVLDMNIKSLESTVNKVNLDEYLTKNALDQMKRFLYTSKIKLEISLLITVSTPKIINNSIPVLYKKHLQNIVSDHSVFYCRKMALHLREINYLLKYLTYAFLAGDGTILQTCCHELKETYTALDIPCYLIIIGVEKLKESTIDFLKHNKELKKQEYFNDSVFEHLIQEIVSYFDFIIKSLS
ncbi:hypothetical protein [Geminocystis sp. GBBB08]|uniref:hypothetical protein n=1 Tax=Geminocystis sp. GBBB08 TaxID=2604140 RepID=UPI0027E24081|nr:hypothetical protein [Geminocystis sp. GBBB08]MBL1210448.1 hypothetical protein [Geminocystis sp. GBBB08]